MKRLARQTDPKLARFGTDQLEQIVNRLGKWHPEWQLERRRDRAQILACATRVARCYIRLRRELEERR